MTTLVSILAKGGLVMVPLLVCSVLGLAVVLERAWFWTRRRHRDLDGILSSAGQGEWEEAVRAAEATRAPVARVLAAGLRHRNPSPLLAMEVAAHEERALMGHHLGILDTIVTLSPLLGLLGTVTGMIQAFGVLAQSGINQPTAIGGGVAEALVATAAGLTVAILVPYNYFLRRVERATEEMERWGSRLELVLAEARR